MPPGAQSLCLQRTGARRARPAKGFRPLGRSGEHSPKRGATCQCSTRGADERVAARPKHSALTTSPRCISGGSARERRCRDEGTTRRSNRCRMRPLVADRLRGGRPLGHRCRRGLGLVLHRRFSPDPSELWRCATRRVGERASIFARERRKGSRKTRTATLIAAQESGCRTLLSRATAHERNVRGPP